MPCLCFPCILHYLDGYVFPHEEDQQYPQLQLKGFTVEEQAAIAEEWYWVAIERETAIVDYLRGYVTFRDGCWWRPPPMLSLRSLPLPGASPTTLSTASSTTSAPSPRT